ncbi:MAG: NAD-dependent malic enzyme [Chloroflexi bacterium]|nr:NAD-dependent malic enzyme [Chloroflexota bacterium]
MVARHPGVAYSLTVRAQYANKVGMLGQISSAIGEVGGDIGAVDIVSSSRSSIVRDVTVNARDEEHGHEIVHRLRQLPGVKVVHVSDRVFLRHLGGKIEISSKSPVRTRDDMSIVYTPGVGRVCMAIYHDPASVWSLTTKANTVAVVSDGTAVLGLGDIGPRAAMPVMEGKALLFKELGGVDAWPICLDTKDPDEIIQTVKLMSTGFGGINLEDISAPRCFYIEDRLKQEMDIPVFHDDQHGTAVVTMAALINALKIVNKKPDALKVVLTGVGAAGVACTKMLMSAGVRNIIGFDRQGSLHRGRNYGDNTMKAWFASATNPDDVRGDLMEAMRGADLFLGLSGPGIIKVDHLKVMNRDPIVFAMANPDPEIWPEEAEGHVRIMATGRSDYPNQINNALCFPGLFRGALDVRARLINDEMQMAAAHAIAAGVPASDLNEDYIMPSIFDTRVVRNVARAVGQAAHETGVAQRSRRRLVAYSVPAAR